VQPEGAGRNRYCPGKVAGESGVAAIGEVSEGEEGPDQGGAGSPGIECGKERKRTEAKIDGGYDDGQQDAERSERGNHQQKDGVGEEGVQIGGDQKDAGEKKGRDDCEEPGVPKPVGAEADEGCGTEAEAEREHQSGGGEQSEGRDVQETEVKESGMHWVNLDRRSFGFDAMEASSLRMPLSDFRGDGARGGVPLKRVNHRDTRKPTRGAVRRCAGEPVLRRWDPAVVL